MICFNVLALRADLCGGVSCICAGAPTRTRTLQSGRGCRLRVKSDYGAVSSEQRLTLSKDSAPHGGSTAAGQAG